MIAIKPGMTAYIILEEDRTKSQISQMQTMVYDIRDRQLILSQTTPTITNAQLGKRFLVTFLEKSEIINPRFGFIAKLERILNNYEIASSQLVPALLLERESRPEAHNLRTCYRINPSLDSGLTASLQGVPVNIVDISIDGIRISSKREFSLHTGDIVKLTIDVDDKKFDAEGMVIRVWSSPAVLGSGGNLQYASIQFTSGQKDRETLLGSKIIHLERQRLAQGIL